MKTILLVEDEYFIRDIYKQSFSKAGYSVEEAADGQEALEKIREKKYDLILLDIMLPKITGLDVLRSLREAGSPAAKTPVILLTNLGQENVIQEALKLGADGYLLKAKFNPQEIVKKINNFFAERQAAVNKEQT